ncbi:MAG: glycogen/starch synthase, partial [Bacilli bacterium]|nr:glycogen/starch synthase [Bacilli bacterium]
KRGSFKTLEDKLDEYSQRYINCLYIMGALERDNDIAYDENTAEPIDIANSEASPMAITDRASISSLLGGDKAFKSLMTKCKKLSMKIILDCLGRISSSRANRKYRDIVLHYLDTRGKLQICYGSDGQSVHYDDSAILNYRKIESWNLLINEVLALVDKYHIDGIHLDNCQAWPQIMEINASELFRIDNDGKPHYSAMEILNGEIVLPTEESGFYNSDCFETYPNPMLVKLTKTIWQRYPNFVFFGECWLNEKFSNNRHVALSRSGIIPRMYTLPIILTEILGKKINRDGRIEKTEPKDVSLLKKWYDENYRELPDGALLVQSSSGQIWPYPALLYGRGTWSAVDLLFTLPDIPMTFMEEIDGEAYRVQIVNVYESKEGKTGTSSQNLMSKKTRSKSLMKLIESKEQEKRELAEKEKLSTSSSTSNISEYLPSVNLADNLTSLISLSGINITNVNEMERKQSDIVKQLGPEQGFDLNKIKFHYNNRRKMRNNHESLRRGKLVYLKAIASNGKEHPGVFAFARQGEDETGIFAINFTNDKTNFKLDLSSLLTTKSEDGSVFDEKNNFNSICYIEDWISDEKGDIYFTRELIQGHVDRTIEPYGAICFGFSIIPFTQENYKIVMDKSNGRMINELKSKGGSVDSYQVSLQLKEILKKKLPLDEFAKWLNYTENLLGQYSISFYDYIQKLNFVKNNKTYSTDFFRYCFKMKELKSYISNTKLADEAEKLLTSNILGPIVFVTPELGRWSTVGGLGVMVDELSQGLRTLGQEVIMISPYYDRNRKGQQNYLAQDPFNIKYIRNIEVQLDNKYTFGVHKGEGNGGIQYYFI